MATYVLVVILVVSYVVGVCGDYPCNGNPFVWLQAKEVFVSARQLRARFDLDRAEAEFERVVSMYPDDANFQFSLGEVLERREKYAKAEACMRRATKLNPSLAEAWLHLGAVQFVSGRKNDAIASARQAIKLSPGNDEAKCQLAVMLASQQSKEAGKLIDEAMNSGKRKTPRCWFLAGQYYDLQKNDDKAFNCYLKAVRLNQSDPELSADLGYWLQVHGKPNQAIFWLNHAISLNPLSAEYRDNLGLALLALQDNEQATAPLRRAVELAPDNNKYVDHLAWCLYGRHEYAEVRKLLGPRLAAGTADDTGWDLYARALTSEKPAGQAKEDLRKLIASGHGSSRAMAARYIADICRMQGDLPSSRRAYEEALGYNPDSMLRNYIETRLAEVKQSDEKAGAKS